ncbi:MAG: DUF4055 domain-containing protein [Blastocatellia bacterium]
MIEDKNKPNYQNSAYCEMQKDWDIVCDLNGGIRALREKGAEYIPPEPAEDIQKDYPGRRKRAVLFNVFTRTLGGLVGMVFRKEPKLGTDAPETIRGREASEGVTAVEGWAENIDLQGSHWTVFAKELFTDAMRDGHAFIYVDMPPKLPPGATLADEQAAGRRPYWVSYTAKQALNWRTKPETRPVVFSDGVTVNAPTGRVILDQITFEECLTESDGEYGEKGVKRYRVLRPGYWQLYEEVKNEKGDAEYILVADGESSLKEIPVAPIYGRKKGMMISAPPLLDLAHINIAHFRKYSDYSEGLRMCIPQLCGSGVDPNEAFKVIGHHTWHIHRTDGKIYFAEPTGAGLNPQRTDMLDLEAQMARLGLAIMAPNAPSPEKTATEIFARHIEADSDLATAARSLKDGLELALTFTTQYSDPQAASGGSVEGLETDHLTLSAQEMTAYSQMQANGQLSLQTLWEVLNRAGKLPENFDAEVEEQRIKEEVKMKSENFLKSFDRGDELQ